ncbi:alpha/beta fold hydrolase [Falsibacillus albus]|uniref:Alpha/beta hydrolase n=1 Tax=Falsibacillus albus TaxID=2478915 RepID=A0A3L7JIL2_9BACI|nr:alpha/beta hydrolase [Falsibacillus albus]RLQ90009.1 alpha/beta hydrolase [Falsibacillus albus]
MEVHFTEWGDPKNPTIVGWHGLTRNGRDFDILARYLAKDYHILCPDTIGRGLSQWSTSPDKDYCFEFYSQLAIGLLDYLGIEKVRWIGTSMGGAIGIRIAGSTRYKNRITQLVLNDIGAGALDQDVQDIEGIKRIIGYVGDPPHFNTFSELRKYYKAIYAPFGLTEQEWDDFTRNSCRRRDDGGFSPDYDPKIALQFHHTEDLDLWGHWEAVQADILLIRGEISDVLPLDVADKMKQKNGCHLVTIPELGHAPALNTEEQLKLIENFLQS